MFFMNACLSRVSETCFQLYMAKKFSPNQFIFAMQRFFLLVLMTETVGYISIEEELMLESTEKEVESAGKKLTFKNMTKMLG